MKHGIQDCCSSQLCWGLFLLKDYTHYCEKENACETAKTITGIWFPRLHTHMHADICIYCITHPIRRTGPLDAP